MLDTPDTLLRQQIRDLEKMEKYLQQQVSELEEDREELHDLLRKNKNIIHDLQIQVREFQLSEGNFISQMESMRNEEMELIETNTKLADRVEELENVLKWKTREQMKGQRSKVEKSQMTDGIEESMMNSSSLEKMKALIAHLEDEKENLQQQLEEMEEENAGLRKLTDEMRERESELSEEEGPKDRPDRKGDSFEDENDNLKQEIIELRNEIGYLKERELRGTFEVARQTIDFEIEKQSVAVQNYGEPNSEKQKFIDEFAELLVREELANKPNQKEALVRDLRKPDVTVGDPEVIEEMIEGEPSSKVQDRQSSVEQKKLIDEFVGLLLENDRRNPLVWGISGAPNPETRGEEANKMDDLMGQNIEIDNKMASLSSEVERLRQECAELIQEKKNLEQRRVGEIEDLKDENREMKSRIDGHIYEITSLQQKYGEAVKANKVLDLKLDEIQDLEDENREKEKQIEVLLSDIQSLQQRYANVVQDHEEEREQFRRVETDLEMVISMREKELKMFADDLENVTRKLRARELEIEKLQMNNDQGNQGLQNAEIRDHKEIQTDKEANLMSYCIAVEDKDSQTDADPDLVSSKDIGRSIIREKYEADEKVQQLLSDIENLEQELFESREENERQQVLFYKTENELKEELFQKDKDLNAMTLELEKTAEKLRTKREEFDNFAQKTRTNLNPVIEPGTNYGQSTPQSTGMGLQNQDIDSGKSDVVSLASFSGRSYTSAMEAEEEKLLEAEKQKLSHERSKEIRALKRNISDRDGEIQILLTDLSILHTKYLNISEAREKDEKRFSDVEQELDRCKKQSEEVARMSAKSLEEMSLKLAEKEKQIEIFATRKEELESKLKLMEVQVKALHCKSVELEEKSKLVNGEKERRASEQIGDGVKQSLLASSDEHEAKVDVQEVLKIRNQLYEERRLNDAKQKVIVSFRKNIFDKDEEIRLLMTDVNSMHQKCLEISQAKEEDKVQFLQRETELQARVDQHRQQVDLYTKEKQKLTATISTQASELDNAMTRIKELESIIASGKAELKLSRQQSMDLGFEKSRLESNLEEHEANLRKEVTDLKLQLKTAEHAMATQKKKMGARIETLMESLKTEENKEQELTKDMGALRNELKELRGERSLYREMEKHYKDLRQEFDGLTQSYQKATAAVRKLKVQGEQKDRIIQEKENLIGEMKLELSGCRELSRKIDRVTNGVPPAFGATSRMSRRHYGLLSHERRSTRYPHVNGKPVSPDFKPNRFSSRLDEYKLRNVKVDRFDHAV